MALSFLIGEFNVINFEIVHKVQKYAAFVKMSFKRKRRV